MLRACLAEAAAASSPQAAAGSPLPLAAACFRGACTPATAGDARAEHAVDRSIAATTTRLTDGAYAHEYSGLLTSSDDEHKMCEATAKRKC